MASGICSTSFASREPGTLSHSRWLSTVNRILRLYMATSNSTNNHISWIYQDLVAPCLKEQCPQNSQQFMLNMMRMRLNLDFHDFAYRFSVCQVTASRTFYKVVDVLYYRMKGFIVWPERHILQHRVPLAVQQVVGKTVTAIIDCFEIKIEKPSNPEAQCQTWFSYKQRNTIKYLIGITHQGPPDKKKDGNKQPSGVFISNTKKNVSKHRRIRSCVRFVQWVL